MPFLDPVNQFAQLLAWIIGSVAAAVFAWSKLTNSNTDHGRRLDLHDQKFREQEQKLERVEARVEERLERFEEKLNKIDRCVVRIEAKLENN